MKYKILNSNTLIPLSSLILFSAFAVWFMVFYSDVALNKSDIKDLKIETKKIDIISQRLSNIEGKLDILIGRVRK